MTNLIIILFAHFMGDFIMQSNTMALNKRKSLEWLAIHVGTYSIPISITVFFIFNNLTYGFLWALINFVLHFATDFGTSRLNSFLYQKENKHYFFVGIGFDQFIHSSTLLITYMLLYSH